MGPLRELLASDHRHVLEFFLVGLRDVSDPRVDRDELLYEIAPSDPLTYAGLSTLVLAITMIATWLPARRAQRVDPVAVLRNE